MSIQDLKHSLCSGPVCLDSGILTALILPPLDADSHQPQKLLLTPCPHDRGSCRRHSPLLGASQHWWGCTENWCRLKLTQWKKKWMIKLNEFLGHCTVGSPPIRWCWQREGCGSGKAQAGGNLILLFSIGVWLRVVTQGCTECFCQQSWAVAPVWLKCTYVWKFWVGRGGERGSRISVACLEIQA